MAENDQEFKILITGDATGAVHATQQVNEATTKLQAGQTELTGEVSKATEVSKEATEVGRKETEGLRSKRETIRALTESFPGLSEAAMFALEPMTLAAFAAGASIELLRFRYEAALEAIANAPMPDLTSGIEQAHQLSQSWDGIAKSVASAGEKYQDAGAAFERQTRQIEAQTKATHDLLNAQKEHALAELELEKGRLSPVDYATRKAQIGLAFGSASDAVDQQSQRQLLAAKYREAANAQIAAQSGATAAAKIRLPESDEEVASQIQALKDRAGVLGKDVESAKEQKSFIGNLGGQNVFSDLFDEYKFVSQYGWSGTKLGAYSQQSGRENQALEQIKNIEAQIAAIQKLKAARDSLRSHASSAAGTAAELGLELPDDRAAADAAARATLQTKIIAGQTANDQLRATIAEAVRTHTETVAQVIGQMQIFNARTAELQAEINQLRAISGNNSFNSH